MPKICESCGEEIINEDSKFCHKCGAKLKDKKNIENKENSLNTSTIDKKKKRILFAAGIIAIVAVIGFIIVSQINAIECETINITDDVSIDVPVNSTHEKKNTLDYYTSDIAEIIIFRPPEKPVDKPVVDEDTNLTKWTREYEDPSVQEDCEIISSKVYHALNYCKKMKVDGVLVWHDEIDDKYIIVIQGGKEKPYCIYAESKNPHVVAQIYNSINYKVT